MLSGLMLGRVGLDGGSISWLLPPTSGDQSLVRTMSTSVVRLNVDWSPALAFLILETQNDYVRFHGKHLASAMNPP